MKLKLLIMMVAIGVFVLVGGLADTSTMEAALVAEGKKCDDYVCVGSSSTVTNRIEVERVKYHKMVAISARYDLTPGRQGHPCNAEACWTSSRQKESIKRVGRRWVRPTHLDWVCQGNETEIGVYVTYDTGRIKTLPKVKDRNVHESWRDSNKFPVTCP